MKKVFTLLFDGYADWELGYVLAELRRIGQLEVVTLGFTLDAVLSMGGLRVTPEQTLAQMKTEEVAIFILPGGQMWENDYPQEEVHACLQQLTKAKVPIAGICAATTVFARAGVLQGKKHTSNALQYMKNKFPDYEQQADYVDELAIRDKGVITASGLGALEFTKKIFEELDVANDEMRSLWYKSHKEGIFPKEFA